MSENRALLRDIAPDEPALDLSMAAFRKGRRQRRAMRSLLAAAPVAALLVSALWLNNRHEPAFEESPAMAEKEPSPLPDASASAKEMRFVQGTSIRVIGDDELLELLKGRPIALVRTSAGRELILLDEAPRPAD
jgi:ferric-dicitrate binding protein FerR (iron transport regulator)